LAHSFLFREGVWHASGTYWNAAGVASPVTGETHVAHAAGLWSCDGVMRVAGAARAETRSRYEVTPFAPGSHSTHWISHSQAYGELRGRFVLVGDTILSFYASASGRYRGFECIQQIDATHYRARGTLVEEDRVLATWAVELES